MYDRFTRELLEKEAQSSGRRAQPEQVAQSVGRELSRRAFGESPATEEGQPSSTPSSAVSSSYAETAANVLLRVGTTDAERPPAHHSARSMGASTIRLSGKTFRMG